MINVKGLLSPRILCGYAEISDRLKINFGPSRSHTGFTLLQKSFTLKDKSGADKIIVKKQPYQLLNTSREFFPSFDASIFHELFNESS